MNIDAESHAPGLPRSVVALVLCVVLLDLVLPLANVPTSPPSLVGVIYVGYLVTQVGLHASLVTLARGRVPLRIVSVAVLAAMMIWNMRAFASPGDQVDILVVLAAQWLTVAIAMMVLIVFGLRLRRYLRMELSSNVRQPRAQFSLKTLAILLTLACVVAGIAVRVDLGQLPVPYNQPVIFAVVGLFALQSILLVPCVLFPRRSWLPGLLAAGIAVWLGIFWVVFSFDPSWMRYLLFIAPALLQLAALAWLRRVGYRLWPSEARLRPAAALALTGLGSSDGPIGDGKTSALLDPKS